MHILHHLYHVSAVCWCNPFALWSPVLTGAAEREVARMKTSTSKSEAMALFWLGVRRSLKWMSSGILGFHSQVGEEWSVRLINQCSFHSIAYSVLVLCDEAEAELQGETLFIIQPTLTYGLKLWVVTGRTRIQAPKMSVLHRVAGLLLRDRVSSSTIQERLRGELLLLHIKWSQLSWFRYLSGKDGPWCSLRKALGKF